MKEHQHTSSENSHEQTEEPQKPSESQEGTAKAEGKKTKAKDDNAGRGEAIYHLSEGWISNPLYSGHVRNDPCICGSGKKVKKCCGRDAIIRDPRFVYESPEANKVPLELGKMVAQKAAKEWKRKEV